MANDGLYESDFFLWTEQQAAELRRAARDRSNAPLDYENIAEEIESLGRSDRRRVISLVENILIRLLKLAASAAEGPRGGWRKELREFRRQLELVLEDSPSLAAQLGVFVARAWPRALSAAKDELAEWDELERTADLLRRLAENGPPAPDRVLDLSFFIPSP